MGTCAEYDSCNDCLDNSCAWAPGSFGCLESCDFIADTSCYSPEYFTPNTNQEICAIAENDASDSTLCNSQSGRGCTACVQTTLSDGVSTCQWFNGEAGFDGFCGRECGMFGCGETMCNNEVGDIDTDDCASKSATCQDCLNHETSTCGWVNGVGCFDSCNVIADVACYDIQNFNSDRMMTVNDICVAAENDEADTYLCESQTDCTSCVATALVSDPNKSCHWSQDGNYCSSHCGMDGCGETTSCVADAGMISANGSDEALTIEETSSAAENDEDSDIQPPSVISNVNSPEEQLISSATNNDIPIYWVANLLLLCCL